MVGLKVVLEAQKGGISTQAPKVINKTTMILNNKPSSSAVSPSSSFCAYSHQHSVFQAHTFLDHCFLCNKRILPGKDIYMYKGDRAFCSVECRCKQIFMDEEESIHKENCSVAAMMRPTSSSSSSSSTTRNHHRRGARNRAGGFAY